MNDNPTINLDATNRRPLIQILVDASLYAFQQGCQSTFEGEEEARAIKDARLKDALEENGRLKTLADSLTQSAVGWASVVDVLNQVSPAWMDRLPDGSNLSGIQYAVRAIRELKARADIAIEEAKSLKARIAELAQVPEVQP